VNASAREYRSRVLSNTRSDARASLPRLFSSGSSREDITGDSVSATTPEMNTAPASVNANSRNNAPVRPP